MVKAGARWMRHQPAVPSRKGMCHRGAIPFSRKHNGAQGARSSRCTSSVGAFGWRRRRLEGPSSCPRPRAIVGDHRADLTRWAIVDGEP